MATAADQSSCAKARFEARRILRVLVVEDAEMIRSLIRVTLNGDRFTVAEAGDGEHALALFRHWVPDVVILDVMIPGRFDGLAVLERMRLMSGDGYHPTVMMLTARTNDTDVAAAFRAGADLYIKKPFSPAELVRSLEQLANA